MSGQSRANGHDDASGRRKEVRREEAVARELACRSREAAVVGVDLNNDANLMLSIKRR